VRLGEIRQRALVEWAEQNDLEITELSQPVQLPDLSYFELVMRLPGDFPLPFWFDYVVGGRTLLFLYEIILLSSPQNKRFGFWEFFERVSGLKAS